MYSTDRKFLCFLALSSFLQLATSFPAPQQPPDVDPGPTMIPERKEEKLTPVPNLEDKAAITWIIETDGKDTTAPLLDLKEKKDAIKTDESPIPTTMTTPNLVADVEDMAELLGTTLPGIPQIERQGPQPSNDVERNVHSEAAEGSNHDMKNRNEPVILINAHDFDESPDDDSSYDEMDDNTEALIEEFLNKCVGVKCVPPPADVECKEDPVDYPPPTMAAMTNDCCPIHYCRRQDGSTFFHYSLIVDDLPPTHVENTKEQNKRSFILLDDDSPYEKHDESFVLEDDDDDEIPFHTPVQDFDKRSFALLNEESPFEKHQQERSSFIQARQQQHENPAFVASFSISPRHNGNSNGLTAPTSHDEDISPYISSLLPQILSLFSPPSPQSRQTPAATSRVEQHRRPNVLSGRQAPSPTLSGVFQQAPARLSIRKQASAPSAPKITQASLPSLYSIFHPSSSGFPHNSAPSSSFKLLTSPTFFQSTHNYPTASANSPLAALSQQVVSDSPAIGLDRLVRNTNIGNTGPSPLMTFVPFGEQAEANADESARSRRDALLGSSMFSSGLPFGFLPNRPGAYPFNGLTMMEA